MSCEMKNAGAGGAGNCGGGAANSNLGANSTNSNLGAGVAGNPAAPAPARKRVGIVLGSKSDLALIGGAFDVLRGFGVEFEAHIYSAHRTPREAHAFAAGAAAAGFGVLIGAAGMAAHLAGALAAATTLPVIALPLVSGSLGGVDALLASVQMPSGVPVACVAVNGAKNAAHLAVQILAVGDAVLAARLADFKDKNAADVLAADAALQESLAE